MPSANELNFAAAIAAGEQPGTSLSALCEIALKTVGAKLFTVMTYDMKSGGSRRIFSNQPEAYPVSGTKPLNQTHWTHQVIEKRQPFVANSIADIAAVFYDHAIIKALGCESVLNVPIVVGGEVVGVVNCLHEAGYYTPERVARADELRLPGALCLLLCERHAASGAQP